jgi:hypothetical protein
VNGIASSIRGRVSLAPRRSLMRRLPSSGRDQRNGVQRVILMWRCTTIRSLPPSARMRAEGGLTCVSIWCLRPRSGTSGTRRFRHGKSESSLDS